MTTLSEVLAPEYGFVLIVAVIAVFQLVLHGGYVGIARRQVFDAKFFRQPKVKELLEDHKKATGSDKFPRGCYPDNGNGQIAAHLPYASWYKLSNAQRAHLNTVEGIAGFFVVLFACSVFYPTFAAGLGALHIVSAETYNYSYRHFGPGARELGAVGKFIALFGLMVGTLIGSFDLVGWTPIITNFLQSITN